MEVELVGNGLRWNNCSIMINVDSVLLIDDLIGVYNNYIRGFIYD